jgi:hypothetical protein
MKCVDHVPLERGGHVKAKPYRDFTPCAEKVISFLLYLSAMTSPSGCHISPKPGKGTLPIADQPGKLSLERNGEYLVLLSLYRAGETVLLKSS